MRARAGWTGRAFLAKLAAKRKAKSAIVVAIACFFVGGLSTAAIARAADEPDDSGESIERHYELGPVKVELSVRPAKPVIGDIVELRLEARAEPGVELLMPEFGEALGRFEIVDFAPSESQTEDGGSECAAAISPAAVAFRCAIGSRVAGRVRRSPRRPAIRAGG